MRGRKNYQMSYPNTVLMIDFTYIEFNVCDLVLDVLKSVEINCNKIAIEIQIA